DGAASPTVNARGVQVQRDVVVPEVAQTHQTLGERVSGATAATAQETRPPTPEEAAAAENARADEVLDRYPTGPALMKAFEEGRISAKDLDGRMLWMLQKA